MRKTTEGNLQPGCERMDPVETAATIAEAIRQLSRMARRYDELGALAQMLDEAQAEAEHAAARLTTLPPRSP